MTLQEIQARKQEIKEALESNEEVNIDELEAEVKSLDEEEEKLIAEDKAQKESEEAQIKAEEEARAKRQQIAEKINVRKVEATPKMEEKMEERKFDLGSQEYRFAWAKKMLGYSEDKFTEDEKRALGDAITTTATVFVQATEDTQGINNAGLLIPTSLRKELMEIIYRDSPFLRDVRKLEVAGNVDLPYLFASDDANWYAETTSTVNEGIEFKNLQLTGWELAKDIVITWKTEQMTVEGFIAFVLDELSMKMGRALATAVLYGDGNAKPTGVMNGLEAIVDSDPIALIGRVKASLGQDEKIGAKAYISEAVADAITYTKDAIGHYPYLQGIPAIQNLVIEVDPFLQNTDIVVGNPKYYILKNAGALRLDKEVSVKGRKVTYGAYEIYDGKAKPNAFAKGQLVSASV